MTLTLAGIGTALPTHSITQDDATEAARWLHGDQISANVLHNLYRRAEVRTRHSVLLRRSDGDFSERQNLFRPADGDRDSHFSTVTRDTDPTTAARMCVYAEESAALALAAARAALADARTDAREVTHLVTVSCSGFDAPGFDIALIRDLRLRPTIARTHIGFMGCHGALNGLRVAQAFTSAEPHAVVLVCALELCSLHFQMHPTADQVVSNALFADGAAAILCRGQSQHLANSPWRLLASGSYLIPNTEQAMTWRIGNRGFVMQLDARVPGLIREHLGPWLTAWLAEQGCPIADVRSWAVHPGGPRILTACSEALCLADDQLSASREVLSACGNMSSPTVVFILDLLRRRHAPLPCVALGFGPGMVVEAALLR